MILMKTKTLLLALALSAVTAYADPIPVEPVETPAITRVQATLTPEQTSALFSAFDLSSVAGKVFASGQLMATPNGGLELRATFRPPPSPTPTPEPAPSPTPEP